MNRGTSLLAVRTALVSLSQMTAKAADLVVAILLVRLLSPSDWSSIALLLSMYAAATGLGGLSLPQGIPFFVLHLPVAERRGFAIQTMVLLATTGAVAAALILLVQPVVAQSPFEVAGVVPILALAVALEVPSLGVPQLLLAVERVGASATFTAAAAGLRVVGVTLPFLLGHGIAGAVTGLAIYAAARLAASILIVPLVTPPGRLALDRRRILTQLSYTAPLAASIVATSLNGQVGKWLVAGFDAMNLGAYAIAATEIPLVPVLGYSAGAVLATRLVHAFQHGDLEQAKGYWLASTSRIAFVVAPVTVGLVLGAAPLLELLFGSRYPEAVLPFQICTVILLHRVGDYGGVLRASGDTRSLWKASAVLLGANLALGVPLTVAFGMGGTALAAVGANLAAWLYILTRIGGTVRVGVRSIFPWSLYARVLLVAIIAAAAAAGVARLGPEGSMAQLVLRWSVFSAGFLGVTYGLRLTRAVPAIPKDHAEFLTSAPARSRI